MQVLLVEDDLLLGEGIVHALKQAGFTANWIVSGTHALNEIKAKAPDILLLDLGLPDMDGLNLLKTIRALPSDMPILILTARDSIESKVAGLDAGADDYLTKPFARDELIARLRVLERRLSNNLSTMIQIGTVCLFTNQHRVTLNNQDLLLSRREYMLLKTLMENAGIIQTKDRLESHLYSWGEEISSNAIEVHIHNLRKKLPKSFIQTVRGVGYRIDKS